MKLLKQCAIVALMVPAFTLSAVAFDHHGGDEKGAKMKEKRAAHMAQMKEKCAKADDTKKCMADMKAANKKKMMKKKKEKKPE